MLQSDILWAQPEANLLRLGSLLDQAPGSDLYVLPEMFATGFMARPDALAEPAEGGAALSWLRGQAERRDAALCGSVAVSEGGRCYNRLYFVRPGEPPLWYDKRHLFGYGGETRHFSPGSSRVVADWRGARFLLQVCYDLRFPVFARQRPEPHRYDAIIYAANWPATRQAAWDTLLRARAIENQCYVLAANRVGQDPACRYEGGSLVADAYGRTLAACPPGQEGAASARLDLDALRAFRQKFPVLDDADPLPPPASL